MEIRITLVFFDILRENDPLKGNFGYKFLGF